MARRLRHIADEKSYIKGTAGELASQFGYSQLTTDVAEYLATTLAHVNLKVKPALTECKPDTKVTIRTAAESGERVYPGSPDRVFQAALRAIGELRYTITHSDSATRTVSFNTGMSLQSWAGQNMTLSIFPAGEGYSQVIGGGRRDQRGNPLGGGGQVVDFGEAKGILHKFFSALDAAFEVTPEPKDPAQDGRAASSTADELERLAELQAKGVLTDEEFQAAKAKLLG